jgi:hypothetical protein
MGILRKSNPRQLRICLKLSGCGLICLCRMSTDQVQSLTGGSGRDIDLFPDLPDIRNREQKAGKSWRTPGPSRASLTGIFLFTRAVKTGLPLPDPPALRVENFHFHIIKWKNRLRGVGQGQNRNRETWDDDTLSENNPFSGKNRITSGHDHRFRIPLYRSPHPGT